jgi:hypothetical protein
MLPETRYQLWSEKLTWPCQRHSNSDVSVPRSYFPSASFTCILLIRHHVTGPAELEDYACDSDKICEQHTLLPHFAETWHTGIRFTLRIGLSAGFKGCTRHLLRALAQWHLRHSLAAQYSGRSALGYSEARRQGCSALQMLISIAECACRLPTMV